MVNPSYVIMVTVEAPGDKRYAYKLHFIKTLRRVLRQTTSHTLIQHCFNYQRH